MPNWMFKEVHGVMIRYCAVEAIPPPLVITVKSVQERLSALGLVYAGHSPGFTIEELWQATIRVFKLAETGYLAEARFKPGDLPIYHYVSEEEAESIKTGEFSPELIVTLFTRQEPVME